MSAPAHKEGEGEIERLAREIVLAVTGTPRIKPHPDLVAKVASLLRTPASSVPTPAGAAFVEVDGWAFYDGETGRGAFMQAGGDMEELRAALDNAASEDVGPPMKATLILRAATSEEAR